MDHIFVRYSRLFIKKNETFADNQPLKHVNKIETELRLN